MSHPAADILHQAACLNAEDPRREGNLLRIDSGCEMIVAGDLHGNRTALAKVIGFAAVDADAQRRLVLQEIIHGPPDARTGHDRTIELLLRAARLKVARPKAVLFLLGNHDLAQATGGEITKEGRGVCKAFDAGVVHAFPDAADDVRAGATDLLLSMPLAIQCPGGVLVTHSLPSPGRMTDDWAECLRRPSRDEDLRRGGCVYEWTWGRGHTPEHLDTIAGELGVEFFILGHRHIRTGFEVLGPRAMTVVSDHDHGCIVQFSSDELLDQETAPQRARPIVALAAR